MKTLPLGLLLMWLCVSFAIAAAPAPEISIVKGGVSPDEKLAIAVAPASQGEGSQAAAGGVYLVKNPGREIIQKIGDFHLSGHTGEENRPIMEKGLYFFCAWSPDGRHVAINRHTTPDSHEKPDEARFIVLSVSETGAVPITLPDVTTHRKAKVYDLLEPTSSFGDHFLRWESATRFTAVDGRWREKDGRHLIRTVPAGSLNRADFDTWIPTSSIISGSLPPRDPAADITLETCGITHFMGYIVRVYTFEDSQWILRDLRTSLEPTPSHPFYRVLEGR